MKQLSDIKWGWVKDQVDSRDFLAKRFIVSEFPLPSTYMVYPGTIIYNQGTHPACSGFASAGVKTDEEYTQTKSRIMFDGLNLYNKCKEIDGYPGPGTYLRFALKILQEQGIKQAGLPCTKKLPDLNWKIKAYFRVETDSTIDFVKQVVFQYGSLLIGSYWYSNWMSVKDIFPTPSVGVVGGHAYRICGWNDTGFIVANSWGKLLWGKGGIATMPYDIFMKNILPIGDVWKLIDA